MILMSSSIDKFLQFQKQKNTRKVSTNMRENMMSKRIECILFRNSSFDKQLNLMFSNPITNNKQHWNKVARKVNRYHQCFNWYTRRIVEQSFTVHLKSTQSMPFIEYNQKIWIRSKKRRKSFIFNYAVVNVVLWLEFLPKKIRLPSKIVTFADAEIILCKWFVTRGGVFVASSPHNSILIIYIDH